MVSAPGAGALAGALGWPAQLPSGCVDGQQANAEAAYRPGRVLALDGLRGVALLAVLAYHVAPTAVPGGFLGVESFFVLSGFLLGSLLLAEHRREGAISFLAFGERRVRRMAPALLVLLAGLVALGPLTAPDDAHRLAGDVLSSLAGVTNWHLIADASSYFDMAGRPSLVRHLWSVAVEIQFYAVCPFLVTWLCRRRRRTALAALAAGVALSAAIMALLASGHDPSRAYYGTDARAGALLSGVALALALAGPGGSRRAPRATRRGGAAWRGAVTLGPAALAALVILYATVDDRARWAYPLAFLATQAVTAGIIVAAVHPGPLSRLLGSRALRWLGVRSFGIYLWHWPAVVLLRPGIDIDVPPAVAGAAGLTVAVVLGALSYSVVERPLMRRRQPPAPAVHRAAAAAAAIALAAGLAGLVVRLPTTDPLAENLRAGQNILAAQPPPPVATSTSVAPATVAPPATTAVPAPPATTAAPPTEAPPTAAPPTVATDPPVSDPPVSSPVVPASDPLPAPPAPPPAVAPPGVAVRAIGDSVMVSAAGALQHRLGPSSHIDAKLSRQFVDGIAVARGIHQAGGASAVVVHLGNNGPVQPADVDALMAELPDVPAVLLVNVRVSAAWREAVNATLAEAVNRHHNARLVDWYGASEGHPDWFQSDGTHFRTTSGPGASAFADLIAGAIPPPPPPAPPPATVPPATTTTSTTPPTTAAPPATTSTALPTRNPTAPSTPLRPGG